MEKIKILMGTIGKWNGGMSTYMVRLFSLLDPALFDVTFLSTAEHPFHEKEILELGGRIIPIPSRNRHPFAYRKAIRSALQRGFDVCHAHLASASNIDLVRAAVKAKVPMVIAHSHCASFDFGKAAYLLHKLNLKRLRKLPLTRMACSKAAAEYLFGDGEFVYVPNAVDLDRFSFDRAERDAFREKYGLTGHFTVGYLGRLVPVKNVGFLAEIFAELKKLTPKAKLLICGDGAEEQNLREKAASLGIAEDTVFTGNLTDPENAFRAMDCFVLPSLKEGLGLVTVEAAATGCPCFISEGVPPEAEVSRLVRRFGFADDKKDLAKRLLGTMGAPRRSRKEELAAAGFDAASQAKLMEKRYLEGIGKEAR